MTKLGKLIQHWPYLCDKDEPQVCVGNNYNEDDVWSDLAQVTLGDGGVLVVGLYSDDDRRETIDSHLKQQDSVDFSRVLHLSLLPVERYITVQAQEARQYRWKNLGTGAVTTMEVPARQAGIVTRTQDNRFHLGNRRHIQIITDAVLRMETVKSLVKSFSGEAAEEDFPINAVLIMEPNLDEGDLKYLEDLRAACPLVDVYIFHRYDSTKWGVEVTGDVDNWESEFPALADVEKEIQEVIVDDMLIKGNVHVVSGPPEAFKTMGLIELSSAVLDERPVFDLLKVNRRYPILFLCADMSPVQLDEWASPFNLRKHGGDFRVMKGNTGLPNVTDPVLQKAAEGRILILDTMLDFAKIQKAFESGEWNTFMQHLRELITVHGCIAVLMTAHATRAEVKSDSDTINAAQYFKDSVTFHGKTDIGFGCKVLKDTSQVKWERIKGRGFKYNKFSFTVAVYDEEGKSNLDRGRFPVCTRPEDMKQLSEQRKVQNGRKANPDRKAKIEFALEFAKRVKGSSEREIADAVNAKFDSNHGHSTISEWVRKSLFDHDNTQEEI